MGAPYIYIYIYIYMTLVAGGLKREINPLLGMEIVLHIKRAYYGLRD
jgi:hypothetical protein